MVNSNTTNEQSAMPIAIRKWNWGAFFLCPLWGLFNGCPNMLFSLIPIVGLVMAIVAGKNGNEWAWKKKSWTSVEEFNKIQRKWAIAGVIIGLICLPSYIRMFVNA